MSDEILRGQVEDLQRKTTDGWGTCMLFMDSGKVIKATCVWPENVHDGDTVELVGKHSEHAIYGNQFKASFMLSHFSGDKKAIVEWLVRYLPQIGEVRAKALVVRFGGQLWQTLEKAPADLLQVTGITQERADQIVTAYSKVRNQREYVMKLTRAGLSIKDAASIMSELGTDAFQILEGDPYAALLRRRVPFEQADNVAKTLFKVGVTDPRRIRAFAHQILFKTTYAEGHCYQMTFQVIRSTAVELKIKDLDVEAAIKDYSSFVFHGKRVMLLEIDEAERVVAAGVRRLLEAVR